MNIIGDNNDDRIKENSASDTSAKDGHESQDGVPAPGTAPAVDKHGPYPSWIDLLAFIGAYVVSSFFVGILHTVLKNNTAIDGDFISALCYTLQFAVVILFMVFYGRSRGQSDVLLKFKVRSTTFPLILWGVVLIFATSIVIEPLLAIFPSGMLEQAYRSMGRGGWTILQLVVLAPLLEEVLFRGLIQGALVKRYRTWVSIIAAAFLFGIVHIIPQQVLNAFVIGIILGYIYYRTESLAAVMIIHALNNAVSYVLMEIFGAEAALKTMREMVNNDTAYYVVYALCTVIFVLGFAGVVRSLGKRQEQITSTN